MNQVDGLGGDATAEVAQRLGVDVESFVNAVGGAWRRVDPDRRPEEFVGDRFAAGRPVQVLLDLDAPTVTIGCPTGVWSGVGRCVHHLADPQVKLNVNDSDLLPRLAEVAEAATKKRRRTFTYCRYCREINPPEYLDEPGICTSCSEHYLGVVH